MKNRFPKSIVALIVFMTVLTGTFVCVHAVESTESAGYGTETSVTFDAASTTLEQTYVVNTTKKTTNAVTNTTSVPSTSGLAYTTTPQQTEKKDRYYPPFSGYNDYGDGWGSITRMYEYDSNPYTQGYVPTNLPLTTNDNGYPVCAQCGEDVYWQLFVETGELIISGYGDMYNMEIPQWWESRDYIKKIIINDGVTNIGFFAFADCSQLSEVIIGNSVETIGAFAFSECVSLKSIVIPDSVKSIDSMAFYGCTSLESIAMSSNIEHLGRDSFKNTGYCNNPENRENGVLYIGNCLVYANNSDYLKSETYEIKDGTRVIAPGAFMSTDAESVIIPESVVEIGECAFRWTELTSIEIPKGVKVIEKGAFDFCYSLETVYISDSVEIIEEDAFYDCPSLSQIIVDENNPNFVVDEYGALFSTDKSLL
ncbi:MAG: leucine-rich repeat domain-containing protein, partial [Erysipelotrichaceae bacterium]